MSGPKCYSYVVREDPAVAAARLEAQALQAARGRIQVALGRLLALRNEAATMQHRHGDAISGIPVPDARDESTSAEAIRLADRLERDASRAEQALRHQLAEARKASFVAQLGGGTLPLAEGGLERFLRAAAAQAAAGDRPGETSDRQEALAAECVRVFERMRDDVTDTARGTVESTFQAAVGAGEAERAPLLVDRLRSAVSAANAEAEQRVERERRVDALVSELGALDEPDALRLRSTLLAERPAGRPVELLEAEVAAACVAAEQRLEDARGDADRTRVAGALRDAFTELGYDVQGGFEVALNGSGSALARRDGWDGHAVRAHLDARSNRLRLHVVRDDRPRLDASTDVEREEELCTDRPALERALAARDVELAPQELIEPGIVPLAVVQFAGSSLPAPRRRGRPQARQQSR